MKLALNDVGCLVSNDCIYDSLCSQIGKYCVLLCNF